jgi:beta-mannosidase
MLIMMKTLILGLLVGVAVASAGQVAAQVVDTPLTAGWTFRIAPQDAASHPEADQWMPATVPGVAQTDLMALKKLPDPYLGANEAKVQWVGLSDWRYQTHLEADSGTLAHDHLDLVFDGLDTFATVKVNGQVVISADNMFRKWRADVKALLHTGDNIIEVDFQSPIGKMRPYVESLKNVLPGAYDSMFGDEPNGRNSSTYVRKAGYQYGWDWGPRVVALGIWKPARLEAWNTARLDGVHVAQTYLDDKIADIVAQADVVSNSDAVAEVAATVEGPDGSVKTYVQSGRLHPGVTTLSVPIRIDSPQRWWPVGYGRPNLYTVKISVTQDGAAIGQATHKIGLRTAQIRREKDAWGRSFELVINGVPIFAKGANLIPFDIFPSRVTQAQQDRILQSAVDANMNILRIWGGGVYQADHVYEKADELGLMIWQDFMFGGAIPPSDEAFRANTEQEAIEAVKRLRDHPSVVIFAGNNEVQTDWENWGGSTTDFKKALTPEERDRVVMGMMRIFDNTLRRVVAVYSPQTPYWASTPSDDYEGPADQETDGDRHYWGVWGGKPVETYLEETPRFMTEYGLQSFPAMATINSFATRADIASPETPVMRAHQKYDKGNGNKRLLLYIHNNYGEPKSFGDFVYLSQLMQAEGIELAASHLRASRPQSMGSLYWQLNDVWPGASWASIDYFGRWKQLQYHARRFYAPLAVSFLRDKGETEAHILSDLTTTKNVAWRLRVYNMSGRMLSERTGEFLVDPLSSPLVFKLSDNQLFGKADPAKTQAVFEIIQNGEAVSRAFVYGAPAKAMHYENPKLSAKLVPVGSGYDLTIHAAAAARGVFIDFGKVDADLSDDAFDMVGGENVTVRVQSKATADQLKKALEIKSFYGSAGPYAEPAA